MRSFMTLCIGGLALAHSSLATPFEDAEAGELLEQEAIALAGQDVVRSAITATEDELEARAAPTSTKWSYSTIPTDNAGYNAMTKSQISQWCHTALTTRYGYSRACIDGIWPSMYRRTDAAEVDAIDATSVVVSSPTATQDTTVQITAMPDGNEEMQDRLKSEPTVGPAMEMASEPTTFATMTRSRGGEVDGVGAATEEKVEAGKVEDVEDTGIFAWAGGLMKRWW